MTTVETAPTPDDATTPQAKPVHTTHGDIIKRLRRAEGHLRKISAMIEEERPCVDVAQQLAAVEAAVRQAKQVFIRDHIDHCLDGVVREGPETKAVLAEFKEISRYL
ncbi:metal-sensing transcriptional repressor [uncultured Rhodospira sp.]|uniref:metal-sensing transcriptional repressor n=1 Tax=uncultured Rhodospira sp. TaxID=1936189 RepID=UPI002627BD8B|nr:metal-sensing transcriptional repressor [uncultured Rhodospira sp.]